MPRYHGIELATDERDSIAHDATRGGDTCAAMSLACGRLQGPSAGIANFPALGALSPKRTHDNDVSL